MRRFLVQSVQGLPRKAGSEEMVEELTGWPKEVTVPESLLSSGQQGTILSTPGGPPCGCGKGRECND